MQLIRISFFFSISLTGIFGQSENASNIAKIVYMDSIVVRAFDKELEIEDLIAVIINDTTFYEAFKRIKTNPLHMDIDLRMYNKRNELKDSAQYSFIQMTHDSCRWMEEIFRTESPGMQNRKGNRYYTSSLIESVFITRDTSCRTQNSIPVDASTKIQKHISELKKLMFQPGVAVNVPLMGNKTAIFGERMRKFYNYSIDTDSSNNVKFTASIKPEWSDKPHRTVIKYLAVHYNPETKSITQKKYHLKYKTVAYQFDVAIDALLTPIGSSGDLLPTEIQYEGSWNAATKKSERGKFEIQIH